MTAQQSNAQGFNPNGLNLVLVSTYERLIGATIERVWENVLDWEHLPWLHHTSFSDITLDQGGDWGWRTWSSPDKSSHIELVVASKTSYVARSFQFGKQVSEIWTYLNDRDSNTAIRVEFWLPDIDADRRQAVGDLMIGLYTTLWNEDEAMMQERQRRLDEKLQMVSNATELDLGKPEDIEAAQAAGQKVSFYFRGREFCLKKLDGQWLAHAAVCPHLLGPLGDIPVTDGTVTCPWHGYRFDVQSGACLSPDHASCRLPRAPVLSVEQERIIARPAAKG